MEVDLLVLFLDLGLSIASFLEIFLPTPLIRLIAFRRIGDFIGNQ